jgi:polygalacturonase
MDAVVSNTPIFYRSSIAVTQLQGSIVLNNIQLNNVPTAVGVVGGATVLSGGTTTIDTWVQGNTYTGTNSASTYTVNSVNSVPKDHSLLDSSGRMYGRGRPTYESYALSEIVSVRDQGAKGDGNTDDTAALQAVFDQVSFTDVHASKDEVLIFYS